MLVIQLSERVFDVTKIPVTDIPDRFTVCSRALYVNAISDSFATNISLQSIYIFLNPVVIIYPRYMYSISRHSDTYMCTCTQDVDKNHCPLTLKRYLSVHVQLDCCMIKLRPGIAINFKLIHKCTHRKFLLLASNFLAGRNYIERYATMHHILD